MSQFEFRPISATLAARGNPPYSGGMEKFVISQSEAAELEQLKQQYHAATQRAVNAIRKDGMSSATVLEADKEAGIAMRRIKEILGISGRVI